SCSGAGFSWQASQDLANSLNRDTRDAFSSGLAASPLHLFGGDASQGLHRLINSSEQLSSLSFDVSALSATQAVHSIRGQDINLFEAGAGHITIGVAASVDGLSLACPDQAQSNQSSHQFFHKPSDFGDQDE
ncbi:MAG: hypothetical protein KIG95_10715, partial [Comamonas sp.]|nr:hypothetical protein [Comamonas sp.]